MSFCFNRMEGFKYFIQFLVLYNLVSTIICISNEETSEKVLESPFISCVNETVTFKCKTEGNCIAISRKCDGVIDCNDGTDETTCLPDCTHDWFKCGDGHCIHSSWVCDGFYDCMGDDTADEDDCPNDVTPAPSECSPSEHQCGDLICIPSVWTCDGQIDCHTDGGSDEAPELCNGEDATDNTTITTSPQCDEHRCSVTGQCIMHKWVCDGDNDCDDGEDEAEWCGKEHNSTEACDYHLGLFPCEDGSRCLSSEHVCDGVHQCGDSSDEGDWCQASNNCSSLSCSHGCINTPAKGGQCYCDQGYQVAEDGVSCEDLDECLMFGSCSQSSYCTNTDGSHNCSCDEGYKMINGSCLTVKGEPVLIFSAINQIRAISVRSKIYTPVDTNLPHAVGVAFDHLDLRVYWSDAAGGKETIMSKKLNTDGDEGKDTLVVNGLDMPEQLAVDEYNKNLYFTESHHKLIGVCSLSGKGCHVLVSGLEKPRGIAIHHKSRQVFYSDWGENKPVIGRVGLNGDNNTDLITDNIVWPNGLAVDQVEGRVYWADSTLDIIETVKIDGTDRRNVLKNRKIHPYSLAVFEDTLYWSDWQMMEILSCNKYTGKELTTIVKEAGLQVRGVVIAHPRSIEPTLETPCKSHHCSHICLPDAPGSSGFTCACPSHMALDDDKTTCIPDPKKSVVMVAASSSFYTLSPRVIGKSETDFVSSISPSNVQHVAALGKGSEIFFSSHGAGFSNIATMNIQTKQVKRLLTANRIGSIAFDPLTDNLFWVDIHKAHVMIYNIQNGHHMDFFQSIDVPQSLLFVPEKNRLLVAHEKGISILYLPEKTVRHVSYSGLGHVSSMVFSQSENYVFIGDIEDKEILKLDIEKETVIPFLQNMHHGVRSLAVEDDVLYWIESYGSHLLWVKANSTKDLSWHDLGSLTESQEDLYVATFKSQPKQINSACKSAPCSHFCFNKDYKGYVCTCPFDMTLDTSDNATCRSTCASDDSVFHCGQGQCVPMTWVCDGTPDCDDKSDEVNCGRDDRAVIVSDNNDQDNQEDDAMADHVSDDLSLPPTTTPIALPTTTSTTSVSNSVTSATTPKTSLSTPISTTVSSTETNETDFEDASNAASDAHVSEDEDKDTIVKKPAVTKSHNGGAIALAVILAFLGVIIISLAYYKCKRSSKADFSLSFTNASFNRSTPNPGMVVPRIQQPDQELNAVTITKRGNTVGYDNPGFDSPWARNRNSGPRLLSTLDWPDSPHIGSKDAVVCDGSSTPSRSKPADTDSAYQEPSLAPSSYTDNNRHFSVGDEDDDYDYQDNKRLL